MGYLRIIQGDTINEPIYIQQNDLDMVDSMLFTIPARNISYSVLETWDPCTWIISISSADTAEMNVGTFRYNVVATLESGRKVTVEYDAPGEVLQKTNHG